MTFKPTFKKGDRVKHSWIPDLRGTYVRLSSAGVGVVAWDKSAGSLLEKHENLRHAPVTVVGQVRPAPRTCPECGGVVEVQTRVEVSDPPREGETERRRRTARAVEFCNSCEYAKEIKR